MTYLLDVNVLIALMDPSHVRNEAALSWFSNVGKHAWATCPMTENAVLRIVGHSSYPNWFGNPPVVAELLTKFMSLPGHAFWPDDVSLLDREKVDVSRVSTTGQITDSYLLALAIAHGGQLATFDRRLIKDAVLNSDHGIHLIQ
jgi:toxin-antitoxin system PIN domain toxin